MERSLPRWRRGWTKRSIGPHRFCAGNSLEVMLNPVAQVQGSFDLGQGCWRSDFTFAIVRSKNDTTGIQKAETLHENVPMEFRSNDALFNDNSYGRSIADAGGGEKGRAK